MAGSISISGLSTGLDTKSIVSQLMALERQPEVLLNNQKSTFQKQVDVLNQLNSSLTSLQGVMAGMNTSATFAGKSTAVADSTVLTAQATGAAVTGTHTVSVTSLAKSQRQISALGYASSSALNFRTGTITITDDRGGAPIPISIAEGNNSLSGIAAAINSSGANLSASILNDGGATPYRLMITGQDTKNYTIDTSGLSVMPASGTPYANPTFPGGGDPTYVAGTDAVFTVDGVPITKSSNSVADVLPGVTLNLLKEGGASTTFTVNNDSAAVTAKINSFITSYNNAVGIFQQQSAYNSSKQKGGVLSGDTTLRDLQAAMQRIVSSPVDGVSGSYTALSQLGISTGRDGTLSVDAAKLSTALGSDFNGVVDLFTHNSGTTGLAANNYGIAEQFNQKMEQMTKAYIGPDSTDNGIISSRISTLKTRMTNIDNQVERMELLMDQKEESMKKQFAAMESLVNSLQNQGNQLLSILGQYQNNK